MLFAFEEAIGFMMGQAQHDKDGISAAAVFAELAGVGTSLAACLPACPPALPACLSADLCLPAASHACLHRPGSR